VACQCIMIAANEGTDAVRTVDAIICGLSRLKAAPTRRQPASWFLPAVHSSSAGEVLLRLLAQLDTSCGGIVSQHVSCSANESVRDGGRVVVRGPLGGASDPRRQLGCKKSASE
jgi:hypothetical protein